MFRTLTFALIATSALGAAALAPTSASASGGGVRGGEGFRGGFHRDFHRGRIYRDWRYEEYRGDWCVFHPLICALED